MQTDNECNFDAKQAMRMIEMQQCDVMQHPIPRSKSPLTAVAENECRGVQDRMNACQCLQFLEKAAK